MVSLVLQMFLFPHTEQEVLQFAETQSWIIRKPSKSKNEESEKMV